MHEFVPVIRKSAFSRLKAPKSNGPILTPLQLGQARAQRRPGKFRPPADATFARELPRDRVLPGPRLRHSVSGDNYSIAYEKPWPEGNGGVNSVGPIWIPRRNYKYNKMKCWVQFLTTPSADTPGTTLLLHFDSKRYLIGHVAEGTQRAAVQRKLGLVKVSDIFLTGRVGWGTTGGILGMILTLADVVTGSREDSKEKGKKVAEEDKQWLNIHGGENLTHLLATARRFIFRKGLPVHTQEFRGGKDARPPSADPTWQDDLVKVWAMVLEPERPAAASSRKRSHEEFRTEILPVSLDGKEENAEEANDRDDQIRKGVVAAMFESKWRLDTLITTKLSDVVMPATVFIRNEQGKIEKYQGPLPGSGKDVPDIEVLTRNPWPGALIESLPPTAPATSSVSYIIKGHPQRGKFLPDVAKKLGVKPGPQFRALTTGESVTLADGTIVTPEQVLEPGKEGGGFAIIDLPSIEYVDAMINRQEWSSKDIMSGVEMAIWILGPGVVEDPRLKKFMEDHTELKHIVSSTDTSPNHIAFESPAEAAIRLHLLDPERFPIPVHSLEPTLQSKASAPPLYEDARVGKTFVLEPKFEVEDDKIIPYLDTAKVIREASPEVKALAETARMEVTNPEYLARLAERQEDIPSKDAEVITLGTGSALPSKYRNVSATLLRVPGFGNYLFDCGENTLGQLKRVLGDELPEVLRDLKVIWISHLHADHHLGTASVIKAWDQETRNNDVTKSRKLIVASDRGMLEWLREYAEVEAYGYDRVEPITMGRSTKDYDHQFTPEQTQLNGLTSIQSCLVEHCNGAMATVFNFPNGFKVAYSGDCRPSKTFAELGYGATLLIHEATFDDELRGDALLKKHSTTSEALGIGKQMNARRILLTHFSQRYQKIPVMDDGTDQVAIVAFDYMRAKLGDFAKVESFKPALMKLYEDKEDK